MTGANEVSKAINKPTPGQPRSIRAQVGLTEDPLPEGKSVAQPEHHHKVEPASHGSTDQTELSGEEIKDHNKELQNMQSKEAKFQSDANAVDRNTPQKSAAASKSGRESAR